MIASPVCPFHQFSWAVEQWSTTLVVRCIYRGYTTHLYIMTIIGIPINQPGWCITAQLYIFRAVILSQVVPSDITIVEEKKTIGRWCCSFCFHIPKKSRYAQRKGLYLQSYDLGMGFGVWILRAWKEKRQSPPQRKVFRFHYRSQKVIGLLGHK